MRTFASAKNLSLPCLRPPAIPAAIFVFALLLSACAHRQEASWREDRPYVLETLDATAERAKHNEAAIEELQMRLAAIEERLNRHEAQLAALQASLQQARRSSERRSGTDAAKRAAQLQKRIAELEMRLQARNPASAGQATASEEERKALAAAFATLKRGRFDEAARMFAAFVARWPRSQRADEAWYWLGEALYAQGHDDEAERAFARVAERYPKSAHHAAALFKWALLLRKQGKRAQARAVLERLLREHPDAESAPRARQILDDLRSK